MIIRRASFIVMSVILRLCHTVSKLVMNQGIITKKLVCFLHFLYWWRNMNKW